MAAALGFKGLLEIKCPASKHQINGVARRHNPDIRLHVEDDPYTLLQAFQQLLVCTEAKHIDIVYFKRTGIPNAQTGAVETHDYVWLARLYRHQGHMDAIRALIRDSIELFVQAMHATKRVEEDTETEDETTEQRDNRRERQAAAWAARVERNDDRLPQRGRPAAEHAAARRAQGHPRRAQGVDGRVPPLAQWLRAAEWLPVAIGAGAGEPKHEL